MMALVLIVSPRSRTTGPPRYGTRGSSVPLITRIETGTTGCIDAATAGAMPDETAAIAAMRPDRPARRAGANGATHPRPPRPWRDSLPRQRRAGRHDRHLSGQRHHRSAVARVRAVWA